MKYYLLSILFFIAACKGEPLVAPATPETAWIDAETHSDTIITNVDNKQNIVYFAAKNWQLSADTNLAHGYRQIAIRFGGDSVLVKPLDDTTNNYQGPFVLGSNEKKDTLKAQNFLDTINSNSVKIYTKLH